MLDTGLRGRGHEGDQRDPHGRDRRPAAGRRRQGRVDLQRHLVRQLGRGGGVGTFSAVNADSFDAAGSRIPQIYHGRTRRERHEELVAYAIHGALTQARRAYELAGGKGRIHANILWEMGGAERIITERAGAGEGPDQRHHLRRRHAVPPVRHRRALQRPLLPDRLLGARVQRAVEARLPQGRRRCWAAWCTRTPGSPAATTACPTARTRPSRKTPIPRVLALRKLMRELRPGRDPDHHGRRRLVAGGMGGLDRQSRARPDRLPVRHPPAADPGKPDRRRLEAAAADAEGRRRLPQPLQPDRVLFLAR